MNYVARECTIARGIGVTTGELRKMAAEGKLTGDVLIDALGKARESVDEQFNTSIHDLATQLNKLPGVNIETSLYVGPGKVKTKDVFEEARKAFDANSKGFGLAETLRNEIEAREWAALYEGMGTAADGAAKSVAKLTEQTKKGANAYASLLASIRSKIEENKLETAVGEKATEADKLRIKVTNDLATGKLKLTAAQKSEVDIALKLLKTSESELSMSKLILAAKKQEADLSAQAVKSAYEEARRNEERYKTYGLTADAIERLTVARLQNTAIGTSGMFTIRASKSTQACRWSRLIP